VEWRQFLSRFRPAPVPGPAGPGSVPVDRTAEAAAELAPVFALLAGTEAEVGRLAAEAPARAAHLRGDADRAAAALESDALARAPLERAAVARNPAPPGTVAGSSDDRAQAERDRRSAEQLPLLTGRAAADVRSLLGLP
jgi:hypothetical protein